MCRIHTTVLILAQQGLLPSHLLAPGLLNKQNKQTNKRRTRKLNIQGNPKEKKEGGNGATIEAFVKLKLVSSRVQAGATPIMGAEGDEDSPASRGGLEVQAYP